MVNKSIFVAVEVYCYLSREDNVSYLIKSSRERPLGTKISSLYNMSS